MDASIDALKEHWNSYAAAYGATDAAERDRLLLESVSDDVEFTNPGGEGKGRAVLSAHIAKLQKIMPGAYFKTDGIFVHHGELLVVWNLYKADDTKISTGYNFVRPAKDGRFAYMAGFF